MLVAYNRVTGTTARYTMILRHNHTEDPQCQSTLQLLQHTLYASVGYKLSLAPDYRQLDTSCAPDSAAQFS